MSYKISNSKFNEILERLSNDYEIYAPVRIKGRGRFSDTDNIRYQKISKVFDIQKENYTETFSNILESATLFLNYISTHIEELSKWFWRFGNVETTQWIE